MKLSVIIPVYNEEQTLSRLLDKVLKVNVEKEIIIVDDYSKDNSRSIIKEYSKLPNVKSIYHERNYGKGKAIRSGIEHVTGDIVIIQDADLEYEPDDFPELMKPIVEGKTNVVYGSRELGKTNRHSYFSFYIGGKLLSWITNILYGSNITDEPTCYKVFKADVIKSIPLKCVRFEFCPEVTAKVLKRGEKIIEIPIRYYPRTKDEGKKIKWKDGVEAIWTLIKYKFTD
ncbi:MAG: glycosyltransferase family 2 protein [Ignavibacteriales bacterium]|nr:glycosyltransferase family 2 protein [Ignavibacteriales bacterium]